MFDIKKLVDDFNASLKRGDSVRKIAEKVGCDFNFIFRITKRAPSSMNVNSAYKICKYLGKKLDDYVK